MGFKTYLARKIIDFNLIPCSVKWKKSVSGIGRIYADVAEMMYDNYSIEGVKKNTKQD